MWLSATWRPTLFLSSVLRQRNPFLAGYSPASKQAGTGRMWAELGICSTPPRDQSSLTATTNAEEKDGHEGLSRLLCLPWLPLGQRRPSPPAWPRTTDGHCLASLSPADSAGPSIGTHVLGNAPVFADTHLTQIAAWQSEVSGFWSVISSISWCNHLEGIFPGMF